MGKGRDKRKRSKARREESKGPVPSVRPQPPGDSAGPIDPYAPVPAPNKPKPHTRSGAAAVPELDEPDDAIVVALGARNPN